MSQLKYFKIRKRLYCFIYIGGSKYQLYHRYIMEKHLKRKLTYDEHIHHKNGNTLDNKIDNLEVLDRRTHGLRHHQKGNPVSPKKNVSKKLLISFIKKGLNGYGIANILKIGKSSVYRRLQEYEI